MNHITALFLLGIFSRRSLALSLVESDSGPVSDQQIIMQLQLQVMKTENALSIQKTWTEHLVNHQDRTLAQLGGLYTVVHKLVEHLRMASSDSAEVIDSVRKNLLEQQERNDSVTGRLSDRLGGLEEQIREQQERATERLGKMEDKQQQMLDRLNQLEIQIGVEQAKVGNNTSHLDQLRDRVELLEEQISGQEEKVSSGEILVAKRLDNMEKVLSGQQESVASNFSRFAGDLSGLKEQLSGHQLKQLSEAAKVMETIGNLEKDLANKQQKIETEGSKLAEVLNGLKNKFAGYETKLENDERTLRDSQTRLSKLQDQVTKQQKAMSTNEAAVKESESKLKILWKNRAVSFQKLGSKYYYFAMNEELNWQDARDRCEELDSHLISLQTQQEYDLVNKNMVDVVQYWTDINDIDNEGVFISSTTGKKANFLKWREQPDNWKGIENCVELARSGMNDLQCSKKHLYICEK